MVSGLGSLSGIFLILHLMFPHTSTVHCFACIFGWLSRLVVSVDWLCYLSVPAFLGWIAPVPLTVLKCSRLPGARWTVGNVASLPLLYMWSWLGQSYAFYTYTIRGHCAHLVGVLFHSWFTSSWVHPSRINSHNMMIYHILCCTYWNKYVYVISAISFLSVIPFICILSICVTLI
jgi:hypothetical protein